LALVEEILALGNPYIDFGSAVPDPDPNRHQCHTLLFRCFAELGNLFLVDQQLSRSGRIMICVRAMNVWRDICANQPQLVIIDAHVSLADGDLAIAN
jgi:hypothetical protein